MSGGIVDAARLEHEPRPPVHALPRRQPRAAQSHRHRPHVPVLGRRGPGHRLARHPPRPSGAVGRRPADDRSHRGHAGGTHLGARPRAVERRHRACPRPDARERAALVGHADRHPARARRPQGVDQGAVGGTGAGPARSAGRLADRGPVAGAVRGDRASADRAGSRAAWPTSATPSPPPRGAPPASAWTPCSCTARTATCCTSSCRRCRTSATTSTAAASRTGCGSRWKCSTPCARPSPPTAR